MARIPIYGADLETDYYLDETLEPHPFLCQWAITDNKRIEQYNANCKNGLEFIQVIYDIMMQSKKTFIYFHNLSFDGEFIYPLLRTLLTEYGGDCNVSNIRPNNRLIGIKIKTHDKKHTLDIRCSLRKSSGNALKDVAKWYGMEKLDSPTDFHMGWSNELTGSEEESEYVRQDAKIVAVAMQDFHKRGLDRMTAAGDAYQMMKMFFNMAPDTKFEDIDWSKRYPDRNWYRYYPKKIIKYDTFIDENDPTWLVKDVKDKDGNVQYKLSEGFRDAYVGGVNMSGVKGRYEVGYKGPNGIMVYSINQIDAKSMYSSAQLLDPMPHGMPIRQIDGRDYRETEPTYDQCYFIARLSLKLDVKEDGIAWFTPKNPRIRACLGLDMSDKLTTTNNEYHIFWVDNRTLEDLRTDYNIEYEEGFPVRYYEFASTIGRHERFIRHYFNEKEQAKSDSERQQAKIVLNSAYGSTAKNPKMSITTYDYEKLTWHAEVEFKEELEYFLPLGIAIASAGRSRLLKMIRRIPKDKFLHADTDSVAMINMPIKEFIDDGTLGFDLGYWGSETIGYWAKKEGRNKKDLDVYQTVRDRGYHLWIEGGFKRFYASFTSLDNRQTIDDIKMSCAGVQRRFKDKEEKIPSSQWVELHDDPMRILDDDYIIGNEKYLITSNYVSKMYNVAPLTHEIDTRGLTMTLVKGGRIGEHTQRKMKNVGRVRHGY